jgi:Na+/H+ antiporter NhaD/arsenite permease-like protein
MVAAAAGSYLGTPRSVHEANEFNFHPIREVAILFAGIFVTMMPALDWLEANATQLGHPTASLFFWGSGALSSVLDNAPTYLSFLSAELGVFAPHDAVTATVAYINAHSANLTALTAASPHAQQIQQAIGALQIYYPAVLVGSHVTPEQAQLALVLGSPSASKCLQAISIGSVFFGANTYIGNGPNFMVKAIADQQHAHTPSFLGYLLRFTLPFMLPMLLILWLLFFRG